MEELIKNLEYAKNAVQSCLKNANCNVDMHGYKKTCILYKKIKVH